MTPPLPNSVRPRFAAFVVVLAILTLGASEAAAQTWLGARLTGFAQARRALARGTDALVLNPAGLALSPSYTLELGYADDFRESDRRFHASITDGQAGPLSGGIGYTYGKAFGRVRRDGNPDPDDRFEGHRIEGGLAAGIFTGAALGVTIRGLIYDAQPADETADGVENLEEFTFDLGFQWQVNEQVAVGLVGQNLTNIERAEAPLLASAAVGLNFDAFTIEADTTYNAFTTNFLIAMGAGYTFANVVPIRGGFLYDFQQSEVGIAFGAGVDIGKFGVDLAYAQRVTNIDPDIPGDDERIFVASMRFVIFGPGTGGPRPSRYGERDEPARPRYASADLAAISR